MAERLIVMLASTLVLGAALAQPLADPTRPPAAGAADPAQGETAAPARLQSVLISPHRSVAVIDGRAIGLGERVGGATLVSIAPAEVILQRGAERQTLKLLPAGVEKKPVKP